MPTAEKNYKLLNVFTGLFVACLIVSNVLAAGKILAFGWLAVPGGIVVFPISYIFGDILTEVYGYHRSRQVIWTGLVCLALTSLSFWLVQLLPAAPFWHNDAAYKSILGFVPRIFIASILGYFLGEFANSYVVSKMKFFARGARGWSQAGRFIMSTVVGEGVDTVVFTLVAFFGLLAPREILSVVLGGYIFKVVYEIIATPLTVRLANWVKRYENVDAIDQPGQTNYNPFAMLSASSMEEKI